MTALVHTFRRVLAVKLADNVLFHAGAGDGRVDDVVAQDLLADLLADLTELALRLFLVGAALGHLADARGAERRDAVLEEQREQRVVDQVAGVEGLPALIAGDAEESVSDVVVHSEDVGVLVMQVVVGLLPVRRRAGDVPLPRGGVDLRGRSSSPTARASRCAPSSMFSMIFESVSRPTPASHAGRRRLAKSTARPPISSERCRRMTLRTYRASFSPRDSSMSRRIASSSRPSASMSASVRCAYSLTSAIAMESLLAVS